GSGVHELVHRARGVALATQRLELWASCFLSFALTWLSLSASGHLRPFTSSFLVRNCSTGSLSSCTHSYVQEALSRGVPPCDLCRRNDLTWILIPGIDDLEASILEDASECRR